MDDKIPGADVPLDATAHRLDMPVALADILSSDGKRIYMRSQAIGMDGKRLDFNEAWPAKSTSAPWSIQDDFAWAPTARGTRQSGEDAHLICPSGYLDDSWFHRAYLVLGRGYSTGHYGWFRAGRFAPAGRMLVFYDQDVFGYGRLPSTEALSPVGQRSE